MMMLKMQRRRKPENDLLVFFFCFFFFILLCSYEMHYRLTHNLSYLYLTYTNLIKGGLSVLKYNSNLV